MRKVFRLVSLYLLLFVSVISYGQKIDWSVSASSFFDNAEFGHSKFQIPQTMAGIHIAPRLAFSQNRVHSVNVGVDMLHEFGSVEFVNKYTPIAYYQYKKDPITFLMGAYPREFALENAPRFLFYDSITYYRPMINGLLLKYEDDNGWVQTWMDWTSRQTQTEREAFILGFAGKYGLGVFYLRDYTFMYHFAGTMDPAYSEALHDNVISMTSFGVDLSEKTFFDKLDVNVGWAVTTERARSESTGWLKHNGFISEATIQYKWLGVFNSFYAGDSHMAFYSDHSSELYWGDPFYRANKYNRTDIYIDFMHSDIASLKLIYSLHACENTVYHQQSLRLSVNIGKKDFGRQRNRTREDRRPPEPTEPPISRRPF